ncbi:hypothetical protein ACE38W_05805 [Chitinophaga sp. Hz27]|uniref:hypothetical protein n=1 Tax=Chitinophaga sp. Hz27 TaxID=3347169 RepID=UPI0035D992E0
MRFIEETARDIIQLFNLNPKVILNWRFKNRIPNRYLYYNFPKNITTATDSAQLKRLCEILSSGVIDVAAFCRYATFDEQRLVNYLSGKVAFYLEDLSSLKNAMISIRKDVSVVLEILEDSDLQASHQQKIYDLLSREEIVWPNNFSGNETVVRSKKSRENSIPDKEREEIKCYLQDFLSQTSFE